MRSARATAAAAAACAVLLAGCGGDPSASTTTTQADTVDVVTSTNVYGDLVQRIGGDHVRVTALVASPDQDPHSFESSPRNQLAISRADLVVVNGGGYDDFMRRMLDASGAKPPVLTVVDISGRTPTAGEELNEHLWYDVPTVIRLVRAVTDALTTASPNAATAVTQRATALIKDLDALAARQATLRTEHQGDQVAVTEPVPGWLLTALGLVDRTPPAFSAAVEDGTEISTAVLGDMLAVIADPDLKALVLNSQTTGATTEQVERAARTNKVPIVEVTETLPPGTDYVTWMGRTTDALTTALSLTRSTAP